jgi:hypothetical protein
MNFHAKSRARHSLSEVIRLSAELARLRWDAPKRRVIAESDEEAKDAAAVSFHLKRKWGIIPNRLLAKDLEAIVDDRQLIQPVQLLQSFFRESKNELYQFRFINAFYNFFFVLEGLFGKGKAGAKELRTAFWSHPAFKDLVISSWQALTEQDEELTERILSDVGAPSASAPDSIALVVVDFIIDTRGVTHHFYLQSSRKQGTPLNQGNYEPVACFVFLLAERAINREVDRLHADHSG